jgi:3,4-dihydroxy 2-butanone 4-phosphate synthase / GTP cyclohydrolase II
MTISISPTAEIIDDIRRGRMVVIVDEEDRENEGDLVMAADFVSPDAINFMAKHGRGLICLTLSEERCRQLNLQPMVTDNRTPHGTAFTVSIEAASGVTTGISAADRSRTVQMAVARNAKPDDLVQPGHIFPLTAKDGGVLMRAGHTEAGCDLASLAGLTPAAVICEILKDDGEMARLPDLLEFAEVHQLKVGTIADLIRYRSTTETLIERIADRKISTPYGAFRMVAYRETGGRDGEVHLALTRGDFDRFRPTLVRVHEPFTALDWFDFDTRRHAYSVGDSLRLIAQAREGALVLLRRPESNDEILARFRTEVAPRPIKRWDPRLIGTGAQILRDLGIGKMKVLAWPKKIPSMAGFGLEIVDYITPEQSLLKAV